MEDSTINETFSSNLSMPESQESSCQKGLKHCKGHTSESWKLNSVSWAWHDSCTLGFTATVDAAQELHMIKPVIVLSGDGGLMNSNNN